MERQTEVAGNMGLGASSGMNEPHTLSMRELRWSKGLTAEQCAAALDLELLDFMSLERGRSVFTESQRTALAELLDVSPADLVQVIQKLPKPRAARRAS